ncbi:sensor histidine kinase [Glutamicibacter arilaitensis]|uniref:sensor histidine kinase n=1 Tax=Glutamicibacter arilaitensis TaxID=256701 RepID=UPI0038515FF1
MSTKFSQVVRRVGSGEQEPETAITYVLLTAVLHLTALVNPPLPMLAPLAAWWFPILMLGVGAIFLRRRFTVLSSGWMALVGVLLLGVGSIGGYFLLFEAVFSLYLLASETVQRWAFILLTLVTLVLAGITWAATDSFSEAVLAVFMAGFVLFTPMLWAQNVRTAKDLARSETARAQALADGAAQKEDRLTAEHHAAVVEERTALAREMHDVLSARLSSIALLSGALLEREPVATRANLRIPLESIRTESVAGLQEMTAMVRMLHEGNSSALRADLAGLPELVGSFRAAGQRIEYSARLGEVPVPEETQTAVYRTVRELLVNHAKHASGSTLSLKLVHAFSALEVQASNPLSAAEQAVGHGAGSGLNNIRARVHALGGHCEFGSDNNFWARCEFPTDPEPQKGGHLR